MARDFPLETIHPFARKASEAFWCANDQGKGEAMYERLFNNKVLVSSDERLWDIN